MAGTLLCVLSSATAFAFVHWPDPWLIAGTGVMGVPWAIEYLLHRNVFPLGLCLWQYDFTVPTVCFQFFGLAFLMDPEVSHEAKIGVGCELVNLCFS